MRIEEIQKILQYFFTGKGVYEQLFNYPNLSDGVYKLFVNKNNFTYDSDFFNNSLSSFLRKYDNKGAFFIASVAPTSYLQLTNDFDPDQLNVTVGKSNEVLKLVPTYIVDCNFKWSIYMDNDLDAFIYWVHNDVRPLLNTFFERPNDDFFSENNDQVFLETIINRNSYRKGFSFEEYKQTICSKNHYLFKCS